MLKHIFTILTFTLLASGLQVAPPSQTPALQVFKEWLAAFNSGDKARISAFWRQYGRSGAGDRVEGDLRLRKITGAMSISSIVEDTQTHLVAITKGNQDAWSELSLELASTDPLVIRGMMGRPVPPPESSVNPAGSDAELAARVAEHIAKLSGPDEYSGAILIAHQGRIVLQKAWGLANNERHIPNSTDTQFCIGSMNKMFTAVAILQLVQQGKISLDKPIASCWPDYPNHDLAARVTVRELLSQTGGTGDIFTPEYEAHRLQVQSLADYVRLFGSRAVAFEPGTKMEYSNYGYILLGRLIELVSGESYPSYVRQHVYARAGMLHTDELPQSERVPGRAIGYAHGPNGLLPNSDTLPWSGTSAGGGYSTVHDLYLFAQALQSGKLVSAALWKEATEASALHPGYGFGFYVLPNGGYGHGGGAPGINGEMHVLPHSGYILVALANRDPRAASKVLDFITTILPPTTAASLPAHS